MPNTRNPEGFTIDLEEFAAEARRVDANDRGQDNVYSGPLGYRVYEEDRWLGNGSLQSVGAHAPQKINGYHMTGSATLTNDQRGMLGGDVYTLQAQEDGTISLGVDNEYRNITDQATRAGITAAGIRRTQQDIAADGEVSRPEQQRIIDMIDRARNAR